MPQQSYWQSHSFPWRSSRSEPREILRQGIRSNRLNPVPIENATDQFCPVDGLGHNQVWEIAVPARPEAGDRRRPHLHLPRRQPGREAHGPGRRRYGGDRVPAHRCARLADRGDEPQRHRGQLQPADGLRRAGGSWESGPGFTGHVVDAGSRLVYMQQRYYDPTIGRFLSVDPVTTNATNGDSFSRFHYGGNNPHRYVDPDGRLPIVPAIVLARMGLGATVGAAVEVGWQMGIDEKDWNEIDWMDVKISAGIGALVPGYGSFAFRGIGARNVITYSRRAVGHLRSQSARTVAKVRKFARAIGRHQQRIASEGLQVLRTGVLATSGGALNRVLQRANDQGEEKSASSAPREERRKE
ncbi:RHS repeat-associated core domain-containing protein [Arenimonas composti]|uniref:RHS repeat-associated core domain-containing protein n=1 Tax=Arenimonas composti TaxID=370776 RepID=UPI0009DC1C13|nr:RHS repeat-associated core domain-containing protein [Arenimonas composti]